MRTFFIYFNKYLILILFAFGFEILFNTFSSSIILNLIENILFAIILFLPSYLIRRKKLFFVYQILSYTFFALVVYLETVYYYLFKTYFSASAIFVSLDTNSEEAQEFINFYLNKTIIIFSILFIIIFLGLTTIKKKSLIKEFRISRKLKLIVLGMMIGIFALLKFSALIVYNLPYLIVRSSYMYKLESDKLGNYEGSKNGDFKNVNRTSEDEEEVYVIIIGESTSRAHLGVYGYYRETTPELEKLKNELLIYKDVISPHVYSVGALTKILTLGNYEHPEKISEGSIIQLINSAGLETYWLSNQRPIGQYESLITKISLSAKEHKFLTTTIAGASKVLDEALIKEFDNVIKKPAKKKVIFLHFMGTHHHYENRYPETFNKFIDIPKSKFTSVDNNAKINHYDNAILYNDFLISQVIKKVESLNKKSFVLYFSDHGEEMFDDLDMAGHNEDVYSKNMFEIPFILWRSEEYKNKKELFYDAKRKYMIDDLFYSVADLLDISADAVDTSRSIFSDSFVERKRIVKDTINYDVLYK